MLMSRPVAFDGQMNLVQIINNMNERKLIP